MLKTYLSLQAPARRRSFQYRFRVFPKVAFNNWHQSLRGLPGFVKITFYCYHIFLTVNWEIKTVPKLKQVIKKNKSICSPASPETHWMLLHQPPASEKIQNLFTKFVEHIMWNAMWKVLEQKKEFIFFCTVLAKWQVANGMKAGVTTTEHSYEGVSTFLFSCKWEK